MFLSLKYSADVQELKALHLYCGAGGMSFVGGQHDPGQFYNQAHPPDPNQGPWFGSEAAHSGGVHISTCWAVDIAEAMCNSFKANHPETEVPSALVTPTESPSKFPKAVR